MMMMMTMVATMTTATLTRTMKKICRSVGICLLELAEGRPPLSHLHPMRALMQVLLFLCGFHKRQKIIKCSTTMFHKKIKDYQRAQCSTKRQKIIKCSTTMFHKKRKDYQMFHHNVPQKDKRLSNVPPQCSTKR